MNLPHPTTLELRPLAAGQGWCATDVLCSAGPHDRPFEEQHASVCIAAVIEGTFRYRAVSGTAVLAPGSLLLGNAGQCFECGHDHSVGDRCLSFRFAPDYFEEIVAAIPGRRTAFAVPRLPPGAPLMPLLATAEAASHDSSLASFEELGLRLAGAALTALADAPRPEPSITARDEKRISAALRHIEAHADEPLGLSDLAAIAHMSRYHFLRSFRRLAGVTPYQFVLRTRLRCSAVRLLTSDESISQIAFAAGFNDLSTFNHVFKRVMGSTPGVFRAAH